MWLFQSVGFNIAKINITDPNDTEELRDGGKKGIRVTTTCTHSGQSIIMETPTENKNCTCSKPEEITDQSFWEVVATTPSKQGGTSSLVETGSDQIPPLSKEKKIFIKQMISFLSCVIKGEEFKQQNHGRHVGTQTPEKEVRNVKPDLVKSNSAKPEIIVNSPNK